MASNVSYFIEPSVGCFLEVTFDSTFEYAGSFPVCSNLPLSFISDIFISVIVLFHSRICFWFLCFLALYGHFCSHIFLLTSPTLSSTFLSISEEIALKFLSKRSANSSSLGKFLLVYIFFLRTDYTFLFLCVPCGFFCCCC